MDFKGSYLKLISCEENPSPIYIQYPPPLTPMGTRVMERGLERKKKQIR
jgi:hypothetical protein